MTDLRSSNHDITSLLQGWIDAELRGDADALDDLLAPDFTGVGPLGFVLSRADWLERHRSHALAYARFECRGWVAGRLLSDQLHGRHTGSPGPAG
jgi:hypothetical protein